MSLLTLRCAPSRKAGPDVDPTPNKSTGINVLEELLKKIIPIIETDYKSLTTNTSQRESYRSHIINAVVNSLTPAKINNDADGEDDDLEEEISINVGDELLMTSLSIFALMPRNQQTMKKRKKIREMPSEQMSKVTRLGAMWRTNRSKK